MPSDASAPVKSTCHCGAVTITSPYRPKEINECMCTICRKYGAAWAYYEPKDVKVDVAKGSSTKIYQWGDRELEFHHCSNCGCVTHWAPVDKESNEIGVNSRLMDPEDIKYVNRKIDYEMLSAPLKTTGVSHAEDKAQY